MGLDSQTLDMHVIGELREIMGDDFALLIDTFINDSAVRFADLKSALAVGDVEAFRRSAHSFKGSAGNLGAKQLAELCRQLEQMGLENRLHEAPAVMGRLEELYRESEIALREMY